MAVPWRKASRVGAKWTRTPDVHSRVLALILITACPPTATRLHCPLPPCSFTFNISRSSVAPQKPSLACTVSASMEDCLGRGVSCQIFGLSLVASSATEINLLKSQGLEKSEGKAESGIYRDENSPEDLNSGFLCSLNLPSRQKGMVVHSFTRIIYIVVCLTLAVNHMSYTHFTNEETNSGQVTLMTVGKW